MATTKKSPAVARTESKSNVNTYIAIVGVATVVVVVICAFIINSLVKSLILNTKVMNGQNVAMQQLKVKLTNAPKLVSAYQQLGSKAQLVQHAMPTDADFPALVTISQNVANTGGVHLKSVTPATAAATPGSAPAATGSPTSTAGPTASAGSPSGGATSYQYSLEVSGGYAQIYNFISALETSVRPISVTSMQMSGGGTVTADLQLQTYYQAAANVTDKTEVVK